ncbi:helix-turn-helix domain-containing protein [Acholeplasma laidlawii]|uniref:helix-turn-helix domain-containing protein n=1 Tax=Acholeplasma laidlawii TaxID=2148 RepID=UPI0018C29B6E|nr:helix-turn-helix domain-containing protein [Acholeplasma laidlawii]MBG0763093.1 helix-turn-helix domain-containing protein [Acholeplasma laidlawii]
MNGTKKIIYTVTDVMEMLNVKRTTIHKWIDKGLIKAVRIGREFRIPKEFFDEFLSKNIVDNSTIK